MALRRAPEGAAHQINDVIDESMIFLRHELQAHSISLALDLGSDLPPVFVDRTQLQQVIVNLAVNAMQAMAHVASRQMIVRSATAGETVTVVIEDTGPGIPEDVGGRLFESFFTTKDMGMGMGLPICRSIIESHGGRIDATNRAEGGARLTVTLPIATL